MTKKKFVFRKKRLDVPRTLFNLGVWCWLFSTCGSAEALRKECVVVSIMNLGGCGSCCSIWGDGAGIQSGDVWCLLFNLGGCVCCCSGSDDVPSKERLVVFKVES